MCGCKLQLHPHAVVTHYLDSGYLSHFANPLQIHSPVTKLRLPYAIGEPSHTIHYTTRQGLQVSSTCTQQVLLQSMAASSQVRNASTLAET